MSTHVTISPTEAADRLAIRELVEAYAHCADRRDAKGQMSLFTTDTRFGVYMNAKDDGRVAAFNPLLGSSTSPRTSRWTILHRLRTLAVSRRCTPNADREWPRIPCSVPYRRSTSDLRCETHNCCRLQ
jgi:hypothetical protein